MAAHATSLLAAAAVILFVGRNIWFIDDDWEFLAHRIPSGNLELFTPHNEHWSTVPILLWDAMYHVFGVRSHVPYAALLLLFHLGIATALWMVMRRGAADRLVTAALVLVFLFAGAGHDDILWPFQIGFDGSVLFGLLGALLADHDGPFGWRDGAAWLFGVLAVMSSTIGVVMVAVAGLTRLIRRGPVAMVVALSVPAIVYLIWLAAVGHQAMAHDALHIDDVLRIPSFIWTGATQSVDGVTGMAGGGGVIVIGLLAWAFTRERVMLARVALPLALAAGVPVLFTVIGLGRLALQGAQVPARYVYIAVALLLPLTAMALSSFIRLGALARWGVAVILALMVVHGVGTLRQFAAGWRDASQASKQRVLAAAWLLRSGQPVIGVQPEPASAPDIRTEDLRLMLSQGALPPIPQPTPQLQLDAAAHLQFDFTAGPSLPQDSEAVHGHVADGDLVASGAGCYRLQQTGPKPRVQLIFDRPAAVQILLDQGGTLEAAVDWRLPVAGVGPVGRTQPWTAGSPIAAEAAVTTIVPTVVLPGGAELCGLQAD